MSSNGIPKRYLISAVLLAAPVFVTGCSAHASYGYRVYDRGYNDYHVYDRGEEVFYSRWVVETRRPHREFRKLNDRDKNEYWKWRHDHR